jgi:hypothetical protein
MFYLFFMGNDQEVEFHEIEIEQIILPVFMRLKFLTMIQSPDHANFHETKILRMRDSYTNPSKTKQIE